VVRSAQVALVAAAEFAQAASSPELVRRDLAANCARIKNKKYVEIQNLKKLGNIKRKNIIFQRCWWQSFVPLVLARLAATILSFWGKLVLY
jgi:hypothetical protein